MTFQANQYKFPSKVSRYFSKGRSFFHKILLDDSNDFLDNYCILIFKKNQNTQKKKKKKKKPTEASKAYGVCKEIMCFIKGERIKLIFY